MKSFFLTCALLVSSTYGHIQLSKPYPIRSPLNQAASGQKDYSYTNPLSTDGSDFPCKGYANDPFHSEATYSPGQQYDIELQGSATHGGGSCQISLSYDKGETFSVIHSILGGCPLQTSYKFTVPSDAPTGEALLGWSWFNKIGNREMYMNCAQVTIGGAARQEGFTSVSRANAFSSLPPLFVANINGPGQCKTVEGQEVNFPLPGPSVEGSLSGEGYKCSGSAPFLSTSKAPNTDSSASTSSNSNAGVIPALSSTTSALIHAAQTTSAAVPPSSSVNVLPSSSANVPPSSSANIPPSSSAAEPSTPALHGIESMVASFFDGDNAKAVPALRPESPLTDAKEGCVPGTVICSQDGGNWWLCDQGVPVHMGLVAAGTHCVHGAMQRLP
ncbi:hypothetical protein BJY04DRAFT_213385 [Aspergillus karnatakaensis]|uniref:uncharacterized protein n=1 Tax=Aspergillus karnatakaensis TaxID=1810916 RepID=UPI003CCD4566